MSDILQDFFKESEEKVEQIRVKNGFLKKLTLNLNATTKEANTDPSTLESQSSVITAGSLVTFHFSGKLPSGKVFDSSFFRGTPCKAQVLSSAGKQNHLAHLLTFFRKHHRCA